MSGLRLYAFGPGGHGQVSFFVAAESEEAARVAVDKLIAADSDLDAYATRGWGTEWYDCSVFEPGVATWNCND